MIDEEGSEIAWKLTNGTASLQFMVYVMIGKLRGLTDMVIGG